MGSSERLLGCVLAALLGGCSLITSASDHQDGTGTDAGPSDASMADASDNPDMRVPEDLGLDDMAVTDDDMGVPADMFDPGDMGTEECGGVADLSGGSLTADGSARYDVNDFTVELWYRPTAASLSGNRNLFGRWGELDVSGSYALYLAGGRPALIISCDGMDGRSVTASTGLVADTWVHIAAIYNSGTGRARIFVNGTSDGNTTIQCLPAGAGPHELGDAADLVIGYDDPNPVAGNPAEGLFDEVRLSDIVRYPEEFTPDPTFEDDSNTVALYKFDDAGRELPAEDSATPPNPMVGSGSVSLTTACRPLP